MKSALVTGGCGFLGSAIVRALVGRGVRPRVLALPNEDPDNLRNELARDEVELVRGDVLTRADVERAVAGVDTVFHVAALYRAYMPHPNAMYEVNQRGTFNVLEGARRAGVQQLVYTASIVSLGRPPEGELGDETTPYEAWEVDFHYSRSKYHSRLIAQDFADWGMDVRIVCPGVIVGPGDITPTPSGKLIINTVKGASRVFTDGGSSYVDVRDAAEVHILAALRGRAGETYIATAHNVSNRDFLTACARAVGPVRSVHRIPTWLAKPLVRNVDRFARKLDIEPPVGADLFEYALHPMFYSNDKSVQELGAEYRPFHDSICDAVAYFRSRGLLPMSA